VVPCNEAEECLSILYVMALNAVTGQLVDEPRAPAVGRPGLTLELQISSLTGLIWYYSSSSYVLLITLSVIIHPIIYKLLRAGSRKQASLRKTDAVGVRENSSSGPAKPGQPLREWIRIHSSRLFPSRSTRSYSCFSFSFY
jgi:hypothetical protein